MGAGLYALALAPGQPLYILLFAVSIVFFCFFYTALVFNPKDVADNLKKSGAFIPGIRPGEQSARYIDTVLGRLTLFGALYITAVSLMPQFLVIAWNVPFYFGGTSLIDRCSCGHGFHVPSAISLDVQPVQFPDEEIEFKG